MSEEKYSPDWWDDEDDEPILPDYCPVCGFEYDDIDFEYQICSVCGHNNQKTQ